MSTFNAFIQLAGATGRPVVFFDFETSGIDNPAAGLLFPPVEVALVVFGAGDIMESEALASARSMLSTPVVACGPPSTIGDMATFAISTRLNPGCKIRPSAKAVHGIGDNDVADAPAYNDPALVDLLAQIDAADPIWCGHNIVTFDLPVAERCGMLPRRAGRRHLDTMRWVNGLGTYEPYPPCFNPTIGASDPERGQVVPVAEVGLPHFRSRLESLHLALCGWAFEGAHGALADVVANVRVASRLFDLWLFDGFEVMKAQAEAGNFDPGKVLDLLLSNCDRPPAGMTGHDGWLRQIDMGDGAIDFEIQKGKNRGRLLGESSVSDMRWVADLPDIDESTRTVLRGFIEVATACDVFDGKAATRPESRRKR